MIVYNNLMQSRIGHAFKKKRKVFSLTFGFEPLKISYCFYTVEFIL